MNCLTVREVADRWRVSERSIRSLLNSGGLDGFKVGKEWRVTESAVRRREISAAIRKPPVRDNVIRIE